MKKAIVTGAAGFVGSAVVRELLNRNIEVLALGRRPWENVDSNRLTESDKLTYLQIDSSEISSLPERLRDIGWETGLSCVFYNFAWSGRNGIADGTIEDQLKNVSYSANAVAVAKKIGCIKFVNSGTLEETFAEKYLEHDWKNRNYHSMQGIYAISKLAARDMCKLVAYLEKIDYVHTRFSTFIDKDLSANGFVPLVLKKIVNKESFDAPQNFQLFDLLPIEEGVKAYFLIGEKGKNKADYFIGSGKPRSLNHYFEQFKAVIAGNDFSEVECLLAGHQILGANDFSICDLINEAGFTLDVTFEDFIMKYAK